MISVRLPDGKTLEVKKGSIPLEVAEKIGRRLGEAALAAKVDGKLVDLTMPLEKDCALRIVTFADPEGKEVYWHSTSHLMAQAVKQLFPEAKLAIGPAIEEGFYYDFDIKTPLTPADLEKIQKKMEELAAKDIKIERLEMKKAEAIKMYQKAGEVYKVDVLDEIPDAQVSLYRQAEFTDMCRGPHVPSTKYIKAIRLTEVAGAYWRGISTNPMLQRIYGISFPEKKMLAEHLHRLEEAEKRDHRKLGRELGLFMMHEYSPGAPFFLPKGTIIYNVLLDFMRQEYRKRGYQEVITPLLYEKTLWETSGHWEHFKQNMFLLKIDEREFSLKPMNCPSHLLIYKSTSHSYRDLPLRIADFAPLHRNEATGTLTGMTRVRKMCQDDAHIFVTPEQLKDELVRLLEFVGYLYNDVFKFEYVIELSTKPAKAIGTDEQWVQAEKALADALEAKGLKYEVKAGEGAFYGPKIDMHIKDALGRRWQCATIQLDFQMPARFGATYEGADGTKHTPIMIHRALLGSIERFMGVLIEHYGGAFPVWLSPVQVALLPVNDGHAPFAYELCSRMKKAGLRAEVDDTSKTINYKIREAQMAKVPYMLVIGDKERQSGALQVRDRKGAISNEPLDDFIERVVKEVEERV
ncbi:putative threonine--tRNA ligase 1 [Candidatus Burarchaeum australiense]|nr:putative threonine--tRNA ligase 1 [Candidatus Burarchaeum australiense]